MANELAIKEQMIAEGRSEVATFFEENEKLIEKFDSVNWE